MNYSNEKLMELQNIAFKYALYKTCNIEVAKDISAQTISLFLLSYNNLSDECKWIINTAKIYCKTYFNSEKREKKKLKNYRDELIELLADDTNNGYNRELNSAFKESFETLNDEELQIILLYFQCKQNVTEMAKILDFSYVALRKKISRIKGKLKAETYKRLGYIGSKRIVTPQLNNLIIKFLTRFKKNLENGKLNKMYYYFSKIDLSKYNLKYDLKKIIDYDINLTESIYKVWVFYKNHRDETDSFYIEFEIDETNHLKILTPPTKPKKVHKIDANSTEGMRLIKMMNTYPIGKTGRPIIPDEEIEKIIKEFEAKQKSK